METILLPVKAKHFKDAIFRLPYDCAISKAGQDFFNGFLCRENKDVLHAMGDAYKHKTYNHFRFNKDYKIAAYHNFDDTLIRTITLSK